MHLFQFLGLEALFLYDGTIRHFLFYKIGDAASQEEAEVKVKDTLISIAQYGRYERMRHLPRFTNPAFNPIKVFVYSKPYLHVPHALWSDKKSEC